MESLCGFSLIYLINLYGKRHFLCSVIFYQVSLLVLRVMRVLNVIKFYNIHDGILFWQIISQQFFSPTSRQGKVLQQLYEKFVFYHDQTVTYICIRLKYRSSKFKKNYLFYLQSRCTECSGKIKTNMWWLILM